MASKPVDDPMIVRFELADHDRRIIRGQWVYIVRGVRRFQRVQNGEPDLLGRGSSTAGDPSRLDDLILAPLIGLIIDVVATIGLSRLIRRQRTWKVAVMRYRARWGVKLEVLHKERLPKGVLPDERIAELAAEVDAGRFDGGPSSARGSKGSHRIW